MNRKLTQPEEIDQALREMTEEDMKLESSFRNTRHLADIAQTNWRGAYVSPYRAEYIRSHDIPAQAELFR